VVAVLVGNLVGLKVDCLGTLEVVKMVSQMELQRVVGMVVLSVPHLELPSES
jgi:hypothetical protein